MHDFEYVSKKEYMPEKMKIVKLLQDVQRELNGKINIHFQFVGSASRKMITRDRKSNVGYDFDVNIWVDDVDRFKPKTLRLELKKAIDKYAGRYGYSYAEDSTSVLTIKVKDKKKSTIKHGCDFAIIDEFEDEDGLWHQFFIKKIKANHSYVWEERGWGFYELPDKIDWLKDYGYWQEVREQYIVNKNKNTNPNNKSRSVFAYTVSEVYNWYYKMD